MNPLFEAIPREAGNSFKVVHFECTDFASDHTWHYHPEYELTLIIRSQGTRFVGNSIQPYEAGDLVLIGPGLPHCWHNDDPGKPELVLIQFNETFLGTDFFELPEAQTVRDMLRAASSGLHFSGSAAQQIAPMIHRLALATGLARISLLLDILDLLASSPRRVLASADYHATNDISPANRDRIEMAHRYVRDNLDGEISQAEIARRLCMTPSTFSRFFRNATGQTFVGFINLLRINEACRLLLSTDFHVTRVAMMTGYNNISHFNRQFAQLKATTPSKFRRARNFLSVERKKWEPGTTPA